MIKTEILFVDKDYVDEKGEPIPGCEIYEKYLRCHPVNEKIVKAGILTNLKIDLKTVFSVTEHDGGIIEI